MIWLALACTGSPTPDAPVTDPTDSGPDDSGPDDSGPDDSGPGDSGSGSDSGGEDTAPPEGPLVYDLTNAAGLLTGTTARDGAGTAIIGLSDLNGDGLDDVAISAINTQDRTGLVYVLLGPLTGTHDLETRAWLTLEGEAERDYTGALLAPVADLTGDGYAELLIGAPQDVTYTPNQSPGAGPGIAYLLTGLTSAASLSDPTARILGEADGQRLGAAVADAGDLDGDGLTDIILGASSADAAQNGAGQAGLAAVFLSPLSGDIALSDAEALMPGSTALQQVGSGVSAAGDLNGDGYGDVVVGADADSQSIEGRVYAFFGPLSGIRPVDRADATLIGASPGDVAGSAIRYGGDTDGDGNGELLISAYEDRDSGPQSGSVYLVSGPLSGTARLPDVAMLRLTGDDDAKHFGEAIGFADDVDGDGFDEILVGCHEHSASWVEDGARHGEDTDGIAYLYAGPLSGERAFSTADAFFPAILEGADTGWAVSGQHDTDGDGRADVLVSASSGGEDQHGLIYVIPGAGL